MMFELDFEFEKEIKDFELVSQVMNKESFCSAPFSPDTKIGLY